MASKTGISMFLLLAAVVTASASLETQGESAVVRETNIREPASDMLNVEETVKKMEEIRLVGGTSDSEGRVEVSYSGEWGTVCDDLWDTNDASVVCRSLGFDGALEAVKYPGFGPGTGTIFLDNVECIGNEASLAECPIFEPRPWNCDHSEDAGVRCLVLEREVRLVGGTSDSEGRVEVSYTGEWGTVCDDFWDTTDASVVCRSLGFNGALEAVSSGPFGPGTGTIVLDDVECIGNEARLVECPHIGLGVHDCDHSQDAGVRCVEDGDVRLVGGTSYSEGRVEVSYSGEWGTVCDDFWDTTDASVVCRSLGFNGALEAVSSGPFGPGTGTIVLDDVKCIGNEASLVECPHIGLGVHDCDHSQDAGVRCVEDGDVRLVGGTSDSEGRVEVWYHGAWGTVCDDFWTINNANVVCRSLGYDGALEAVNILDSAKVLEPSLMTSIALEKNRVSLSAHLRCQKDTVGIGKMLEFVV
eukprot:XP_011664076.1 PREDICTED: scavenger receptor cysteine-rich type 1 protein M130-like [Strongylocentrotus purpuratus]